MKKQTSKMMISVGLAILISQSLHAAVIASYTFDTKDAAGFAPSETGLEASASSIAKNSAWTSGSGLGYVAIHDTGNDDNLHVYPDLPLLRFESPSTNLRASLDSGHYFSLTITPQSGLTFEQLTFDLVKGGDSVRGIAIFADAIGSGFDIGNIDFVSDANALHYVNNISSYRVGAAPNVTIANPNDAAYTVDLTSFSYLENVTDPVTFYFYVWTSGGSVEMDNLTFHGVPEPSCMALLVLGAAAVFRRRGR